ncbi:MAG: sodium:proton antiporter [Chitinophagales bacterium]|nr:MAG: sodium:proton antiporter [Chitinophagales bacterium]
MRTPSRPSLLLSLIPIIFLLVLLVVNVVFIYGDDALGGANQMALLLSAAVAGAIAMKLGYSWQTILDGIVSGISNAMGAILILLLIGSLAGTWMLSGIVPAMIYYGLNILNPGIFLFAACIICSIVSLATGSSWSTAATVGIALLGIGKALGIQEGIIAGAIISGAYFGDKMSPLSDTTNLASAMAGTDLITHVKYMTLTTLPSLSVALLLYLGIGLFSNVSGQVEGIHTLQAAIASKFNISGWLFVVPLLVVGMIAMRVPAIPALLAGTLLGAVAAILFQPHLLPVISGISDDPWKAAYRAVTEAMTRTIQIQTDNEMVNDLLTSGGMAGMLDTVWLIVCAMTFGGVMEVTGMLRTITSTLLGMSRSEGALISTTALSCIVFNLTASDQYLAIVVPGRMFREEYKKRGLDPRVLSRTLEDSGTVTSALVPWNTCGAYHSGVLGVATGDYFLYAFFNLLSPVMTMLFGYLNIRIVRLKNDNSQKQN